MTALGIHTGEDLRRWSLPALQKHFGKWSQFLHDIARGIDERPVDNSYERKSIGAETTFAQNLSEEKQMLETLEELSQQVAKSLAKNLLLAETLSIKVRYPDFTTVTRQCRTRSPVQSHEDIKAYLPHLLRRTEASAKSVRLLGLSVSHLIDRDRATPQQLNLHFKDIEL